MEENLEVMFLIERYATTMFAEYGVSAEGISLALDCETWVKDSDKSNYVNRILIYLNTYKSEITKGI